MLREGEAILIGYCPRYGLDEAVMTVGRKRINGTMEIINALQGEEAEELWKKLTTKKTTVFEGEYTVKDGRLEEK